VSEKKERTEGGDAINRMLTVKAARGTVKAVALVARARAAMSFMVVFVVGFV